MVVISSPSLSLNSVVVFPDASSPTISILTFFAGNMECQTDESVPPMVLCVCEGMLVRPLGRESEPVSADSRSRRGGTAARLRRASLSSMTRDRCEYTCAFTWAAGQETGRGTWDAKQRMAHPQESGGARGCALSGCALSSTVCSFPRPPSTGGRSRLIPAFSSWLRASRGLRRFLPRWLRTSPGCTTRASATAGRVCP